MIINNKIELTDTLDMLDLKSGQLIASYSTIDGATFY